MLHNKAEHLSSQFNAELTMIANSIMEMSGFLEKQLQLAIDILKNQDISQINTIIELEKEIELADIKHLRLIANIIARRQPTAKDLRLILAVAKVSYNIEQAGDELVKVANKLKALIVNGSTLNFVIKDLRTIAKLSLEFVHLALDSFARLDMNSIDKIELNHNEITDAFNSFTRQLMTYMMEDPRTISTGLDLIFIAKAFEKVSDYADYIAKLVHYIVDGEDIRKVDL